MHQGLRGVCLAISYWRMLVSVTCSIGAKECHDLYNTKGGHGQGVSPLEILEVRSLRLAVVLTVHRGYGLLLVSGVCSDLATSSCAPSCGGASADAVWCQLFVRYGLHFNPSSIGKVLFITLLGIK